MKERRKHERFTYPIRCFRNTLVFTKFPVQQKSKFPYSDFKRPVVKLARHVFRVGWPKSCMPVLTRPLVTEGCYFQACFGQLRIYTDDNKHKF